MKQVYYAVYDISEDRIRTNVILALKSKGFIRIQKSVFCGRISSQQKKDLLEDLKSAISDGDSCYLIRSCNACFGKLDIIGEGFDKAYVIDQKKTMVI